MRQKSRKKKFARPKLRLGLPGLDQSKAAVLGSLRSQRMASPAVALASLATMVFSSAFILSRTNTGPGTDMPAGGETAHVGTCLRQENLCRSEIHSRNRVGPLKVLFKRTEPVFNLAVQPFDALI